jgi:uncharacterized protein
VKFKWNPAKDEANRTKYGIGFEEAATVFADRFALSWEDPGHSIGEYRTLTLGYTDRGRLAIVAHTERGEGVRIITARLARAQEMGTRNGDGPSNDQLSELNELHGMSRATPSPHGFVRPQSPPHGLSLSTRLRAIRALGHRRLSAGSDS